MSIVNTLEIHPAAEVFPMMSDDDIKELAEDIQQNGLTTEIEIFEGKVIDGRNRLKACKMIEYDPQFRFVTDVDPWDYVISKNLKRRHLTPSQKSILALEIAKARSPGDPSQKRGGLPPISRAVREKAAAIAGVSTATLSRAIEVANDAPELLDEIKAGKVNVRGAAITAKSRKKEKATAGKKPAGKTKNDQPASPPKNGSIKTLDSEFKEIFTAFGRIVRGVDAVARERGECVYYENARFALSELDEALKELQAKKDSRA